MTPAEGTGSSRGEAGLTVVELAIALVVLAVVLGAVLQLVAAFERTAAGGIRRLENLGEGRILMQVLTKDIRTAAKLTATDPPFLLEDPGNPGGPTLADDNEMTFYANLNLTTSCPKVVHVYVNADRELVEEVTEPSAGTPPDCEYPSGPGSARVRLVGRYVANDLLDPAEAIFTYYYVDEEGQLVPFSTDDTPLVAADALLVKAVGVRLALRRDSLLPVPETVLVNRVRLPNVYYNPPPT